jgi:glycosyltransferase involved in cell wall biosynthesis
VRAFSIILPVRNGGEYIKECVNSILQQGYTEFNLLVLDNCSTDGTLQWLNTISDRRIEIFPSARPLTIEENWDRVRMLNKNEYMTMIGYDDILFPEYLQVMNQLIEKHPSASLYQTHFTYIDPLGKTIRNCQPMAERETGLAFMQSLLSNRFDLMGTGFMMRSVDYDRVGGIPLYPNLLFADFELWMKLTQTSYKATSPQTCFSFRLHQSTTSVSPDKKFQQAFERFITYLETLKGGSPDQAGVIREHAGGFLLTYCKGLSHRLLRTPKNRRDGLTVGRFIHKCREYADRLGLENFHPEKIFSVRLARWIDTNPLSRSAFLLFKKLFPKPLLR